MTAPDAPTETTCACACAYGCALLKEEYRVLPDLDVWYIPDYLTSYTEGSLWARLYPQGPPSPCRGLDRESSGTIVDDEREVVAEPGTAEARYAGRGRRDGWSGWRRTFMSMEME